MLFFAVRFRSYLNRPHCTEVDFVEFFAERALARNANIGRFVCECFPLTAPRTECGNFRLFFYHRKPPCFHTPSPRNIKKNNANLFPVYMCSTILLPRRLCLPIRYGGTGNTGIKSNIASDISPVLAFVVFPACNTGRVCIGYSCFRFLLLC